MTVFRVICWNYLFEFFFFENISIWILMLTNLYCYFYEILVAFVRAINKNSSYSFILLTYCKWKWSHLFEKSLENINWKIWFILQMVNSTSSFSTIMAINRENFALLHPNFVFFLSSALFKFLFAVSWNY